MSGGITFNPNLLTLGANAIGADELATDAIGADELAASAVAEIGDEVRAELNAAVPASPTADSLFDILSKTDNNTFSRSTDSLEALADAIASIVTGTYMQRSANSGSLLMTGAEQTLYESTPGTPFEFGGGSINIPASAAATFSFRAYVKNKSGGAYFDITGAVSIQDDSGNNIYPSSSRSGLIVPMLGAPRFNVYGLKITLQQTGVGAGYVTVDHEWLDTLG